MFGNLHASQNISKVNEIFESLVLSGPLESGAVVRSSVDNTGCDCAAPSTSWASAILASWQCVSAEGEEGSAGRYYPQFAFPKSEDG